MDIVEIGAGCDIITPLATIIQNIGNPHHTFLVPADCGYSGRDITKLLHREGIRTWGHMVMHDSIMFNTSKQDAPQAQAILDKSGITTQSEKPKGSKQEARGKGKEPYQPGKGWWLLE